LYHDLGPTGNREIVSIMSISPVRARIRTVLKGTDYLQVEVDSLPDVELPDRLLRRRTFSSIDAMAEALAEIGVKEAA
jgi:hypothetical protein